MSTRKQILTQGNRQREPKSPQIYRRGRVNNSVAYYRGAKPDATAGSVNATAAKFLSDIAKPLGQIAGKKQQEFQEAQRNEGIASFTRATPEQRAKMRNAIKNGIISESESPYFREGVSIAYTKSLLGKYNQDLFQRYEQWKDKNKEDSGNFDQFLDKFDSEYAPHFETIHQDILTEHFIPGQMGVRRQLQQRHTEHLNKNYRDQADSQYSGAFHQMMQDYLGDAYAEQLKSNETLRNMVSTQEADHINTLTTEEGLMGALKDGTISKKHRDLLSQGKYGQAILKEYDERFGTKPVGPTSQTPSMDWLYRERTLELNKDTKKPVGNLFKNVIAPGEIQGGNPKDKVVKVQKGKGYRHVIESSNPTMFAKMSEKEKKEAVAWVENYNKKFNKDLKTGDSVKWNWQQFIRWQKYSKKNK